MKIKIPGTIEGEIDKTDYDFLQKISSSDFAGLIAGDWIREWRWSNLVKIAERVRKRCEANNYDPGVVGPKFLSQFFEAGSLEDNDTLQEMWANLLINKSLNSSVDDYYISTLKSFRPIEAQLLNALFRESEGSCDINFDFTKITKNYNISNQELAVIVHKMYSLNLLRTPQTLGPSVDKYPIAVETTRIFRFTELGVDFCEACTTLPDQIVRTE